MTETVAAKEASPVNGKDRILMIRVFEDRMKKGASKLALQTKHDWKIEAKSDSTSTKDGTINSAAEPTVTLEINAISSRDDVNLTLKDAVLNSKKLEFWDIDLKGKVTEEGENKGKYPAKYAQGYLQSWEVPSEIGKLDELKTEANIDQKPVDGFATLTDEQQQEVQYAFADTTIVTDPAPEV